MKRPDLAKRNRERATHGLADTRTHNVWDSMRQRCENPRHAAFKDYGGRGIVVCPRWGSFTEFLADMGEAPAGKQLDRIDNNGDYAPGNCRWVTSKENCRNRRSCVYIEHQGARRSIAEWAEITGLERKTLQYRHRAGWSAERALGTPSITNRKNTNDHFVGVNQ